MRKYSGIFISLFILSAAAVGASRWADALQYSLFTFQSPLLATQLVPGDRIPPQTRRVVVVVVSGLSYDAVPSADMPNLEALLEAGASATMISQPPTYPLPAWTTQLTGAWPELNSASILMTKTSSQRPILLDHLIAAVHDAGLRTAIAGHEGLESLLSADTVDASFYTAQEDAIGDAQVAQAALEFVSDPQYNLIMVYFSQVDAVGRAGGVNTDAYNRAAHQVDNHLRQIVRLVDAEQAVLIVTSDHGLTEDGWLGGNEPDLTRLPFVMIGRQIVPGVYSLAQQIDLAPTVAALLGGRLPAVAQGHPLYEMLQLDQESLTLGQLQLAKQKASLGDAYLRVMGLTGLSQAIYEDLHSAQQALLDGNQAGALELATLISEEVVAEMGSARAARISSERVPRLAVIAAGLCLALLFFWWRREPHTLMCIITAGVAVGIYYGWYRLAEYTFSLSSVVGTIDGFTSTLVRYAVTGMITGGLLLLLGLLLQDERRWTAAIATAYDYGLYAVFLAAMPALVSFWKQGATIRWYLPEMGLTLLQFVALVQVAIVALIAIPLPWLIAFVVYGVGRWRTYSEARAQTWDPIDHLRHR
jgi:hypothetical protein